MSATVPRRRILIATAAAGITGLPTAGFAQPRPPVYRVGVLAMGMGTWREFVAELTRRGYTEGINIVFERPPVDLDRANDLDRVAGELVKAKVDVIYTQGGSPALAAQKATTTIPIVFQSSPDPVSLGLVQSLSRPGANLTGSSVRVWETNQKELQLFAEATGKLTSMVYFFRKDVTSFAARLPNPHTTIGLSR